MVGASGVDELHGGSGQDIIIDGDSQDASIDNIYAGDHDDKIDSANIPASKDIVDCGPGIDTVRADALDIVNGNCENVNNSPPETTLLEPSPDSDLILGEVSATELQGVVDAQDVSIVDVKGEGTGVSESTAANRSMASSDPTGYELVVDYENNTYTAETVPEEEAQQTLDEEQGQGETDAGSYPNTAAGDISTQANRAYWYYPLILTTRDPPGYRLARSKHELHWSSGSSVLFNYRVKRARAFDTPCPLLCTHWYVHRNTWRANPYYIDGGRTLVSQYGGVFYNYDFLFDSRITIAHHRSTIFAYNSNRVNWSWIARYEGEASRLLSTTAIAGPR